MKQLKAWCWQAAQDNQGPDWLFLAYFTPDSIPTLAAATENLELTGYTLIPAVHEYCPDHQLLCPIFTFIDSTNADAYQRNLTGTEQRNIWIYHLLQIHDNKISLEAGYGGRGASYAQLETKWLLQLFNTPGITLHTWQIVVGGNGYDYLTLQAGSGINSFISYLT